MILETQKYWLALEPTVEIVTRGNSCFLFDTLSGKSKKLSNCPELITLLSQFEDNNNVILYDSSESSESLARIVDELFDDFFVDLVPRDENQRPPIHLRNIINIQRSEEMVAKDKSEFISIGDEILAYLKEITIYLNTGKNDSLLKDAHKQFRYCSLNQTNENELAFEELHSFLNTFNLKQLGSLNLAGINLLSYSELDKLLAYIDRINLNKNLLFHWKVLLDHQAAFLEETATLSAKHLYTTVVYLKAGEFTAKDIENLISLKEKSNIKIFCHFIIESEADYLEVEKIIEKYKIVTYHIFPYHNGSNIEFFKENIFLEEEEILQQELSLKNIHTRKTVNTNFFGLLNIGTNGNLYSSLNQKSIGNIKTIKAVDAILNEFSEKTSWFDTKVKDKTCGQCLYNTICPPKSNYEHYFGHSNLCNKTPSA